MGRYLEREREVALEREREKKGDCNSDKDL